MQIHNFSFISYELLKENQYIIDLNKTYPPLYLTNVDIFSLGAFFYR